MLYQTQLAQVRPYQQQISNIPSYQTSTSERSITPPVSCSPQAYNWLHQQQIISPLALDYQQIAYSCRFVGQLQGSYEVEVPAGIDRIKVIVPTVPEGERQHAIVRQVCHDWEALPDQFIHEDGSRFNLCSTDGNIQGVMMKGMNMKYSIEWTMNDGTKTIWRRTGNVGFTLVSVDSLVPPSTRRGSISSVCSLSSIMSNSIGPPELENHHGALGLCGYDIRPELLRESSFPRYKEQRRDYIPHTPSVVSNNVSEVDERPQRRLARSSNLATTKIPASQSPEPRKIHVAAVKAVPTPAPLPKKPKPKNEQEVFNEIKKLCIDNPALLKKVLKWGNIQTSVAELTREDLEKLSSGRVWVTASLEHPATETEEDVKWQDALDDLKGAYQEVQNEPNTFIQPAPQQSEPGKQHRLKKVVGGLWVIDECKMKSGSKWGLCAEELPSRQWIDHRNNRKNIEVKVVPLIRILERMGERLKTDQNQDVERCVQFLFNSCNQKKLNSKLKTRNLKHNIANLKVKLDKQYSLSFAVKVANTADTIAQEERGK